MGFRTIEISDPSLLEGGLRFVTVKSPALRRRADLSFYVPEGLKAERLPLVILLHGVYSSHWAWLFKGGAHRVLDRLIEQENLPPMMLAMPSDGLWGDGSGYVRHVHADYSRWIVEEVAEIAALVEPRSVGTPRFLCGLSMGGYGALRLGALHPDVFQGVSAHSSITGPEQITDFVEETREMYELEEPPPLDVLSCLAMNPNRIPPLRFDCGTEDPLIGHNRQLHTDLVRAGIRHEYQEFPGGHEWPYWHEHLADSLHFFGRQLTAK